MSGTATTRTPPTGTDRPSGGNPSRRSPYDAGEAADGAPRDGTETAGTAAPGQSAPAVSRTAGKEPSAMAEATVFSQHTPQGTASPEPRPAAPGAGREPHSAAGAGSGGLSEGFEVIPGAGPAQRPGERPTLRLREGEPEEPPRYAPEWLRLREPADAAARSAESLDPLRIRLANLPSRHGGLIVHDLGCGTGSMGRWLAPLLDGAQHWILHDRDPYLLHFAAVASPRAAADGSRVTVETRRGDVARLTPDALIGASLVTASALLDVLTREEVDTLAAACAGAGCPALLTLSVVGRVEITPADPLDAEITAAFNDHQRRSGLLGPDAVGAACEAFAAHGATVHTYPSPWRLGPDHRELTAQWLRGWVGAAVEQRPELRPRADRYLAERLESCAAGELRVVVHHSDLLALSRPTGGAG